MIRKKLQNWSQQLVTLPNKIHATVYTSFRWCPIVDATGSAQNTVYPHRLSQIYPTDFFICLLVCIYSNILSVLVKANQTVIVNSLAKWELPAWSDQPASASNAGVYTAALLLRHFHFLTTGKDKPLVLTVFEPIYNYTVFYIFPCSLW